MIQYSIIVCSYNRSRFLQETIESLLTNFKDQEKYELIIIDNNSSDDTAEVVAQYRHVPVVRYVLEKNQGLSYARNRGIREARYPVIVFLDDDIAIEPGYLEVLDKHYADPSVHIVGGKVLPYQAQVPDWLPRKYYYLVSVYDMGNQVRNVTKLLGANHSFRKEVADQVGDYNVKIGPLGDFKLGGDENEFLLRAQQKGYKLLYDPALIVYHKIQNRFNKPFVLMYSYNIGATEANIDFTHQRGLLMLKCGKYLADSFLRRTGMKKDDPEDFVADIRREHQRGYLEFVGKAVKG